MKKILMVVFCLSIWCQAQHVRFPQQVTGTLTGTQSSSSDTFVMSAPSGGSNCTWTNDSSNDPLQISCAGNGLQINDANFYLGGFTGCGFNSTSGNLQVTCPSSTNTITFQNQIIPLNAAFREQGLPSAVTGYDILAADSSTHTLKLSQNGGSFVSLGIGNVNGPGSSTSGNIATYNGTTGNTIQDSGWNISSSTLLSNSTLGMILESPGVTRQNVFNFTSTGNLTLATTQNFINLAPTFASSAFTTGFDAALNLSPTFNLTSPTNTVNQYGLYIKPTATSTSILNALEIPSINNSTNSTSDQHYVEFGNETIASGSVETITNASTLHISGSPVAGTNVTITNPYAVLVDSGTVQTTTGKFNGAGIVSIGTKFSASGCSFSASIGGATAGTYTSGTTGTCTVTITMGNSLAAPNGWACSADDRTTNADKQTNSASTTTTATITGTTVSGDVISFHCEGY